jgi:FAD/FMN-containing dehydrogenase
VAAVVKIANDLRIPVVPRDGGTVGEPGAAAASSSTSRR